MQNPLKICTKTLKETLCVKKKVKRKKNVLRYTRVRARPNTVPYLVFNLYVKAQNKYKHKINGKTNNQKQTFTVISAKVMMS